MRADHWRGSSQWWPTTTPARSAARNSAGGGEVGHLDVGGADRVGDVGVAARASGEIELGGERGGPAVQARQGRLGVVHLDRVDQTEFGELVEGGLGEVATHRVERMGDVDETTLLADRACRPRRDRARSAPARRGTNR